MERVAYNLGGYGHVSQPPDMWFTISVVFIHYYSVKGDSHFPKLTVAYFVMQACTP